MDPTRVISGIQNCAQRHSQGLSLLTRACERSGKRSGATRKSGGAERSGERAWEKNDGAERGAGGRGAGTERGAG